MITISDFIKNKEMLSIVDPINIDSIMIQHRNSIETHFFQKEIQHTLRSISKLLVAMAIGIAIEKKMKVNGLPLTLETKIYPIIKDLVEIKNIENLAKIEQWTVWNLLTHSTGYEKQMMSEKLVEDVDKSQILDYALNYDIPFEVGARYAYNNVEPFVLSVFFQEAFSVNLSDFVSEHVFRKLEIIDYSWENYGKYCIGATGLYVKHSDLHKIGQLLLYNGRYQNIQVIDSNWITQMCSIQIETVSEFKAERVLPKIYAGYFTFISRDGFIFRDGANGQYIIINKKQNLLITILSSEPEMRNVTEILRGLL